MNEKKTTKKNNNKKQKQKQQQQQHDFGGELWLWAALAPNIYMTVLRWYFQCNHYENTPIQIYWKFYHQKMKIFR